MATPEEIATLREMVDEPTEDVYADERLSELIDSADGDLRKVAARIWSSKAAKYATLVDVQEGSSRRSLGDLQEQALAMVKLWQSPESGAEPERVQRPGRTRPIERP